MKNSLTLFKTHHQSKSIVLPALIDIDKLLKDYPPRRKGVRRDVLVYLINLLYRKSLYHDGYYDNKQDGFIPIKMQYLRQVCGQVRNSLDYLIDLKIVLCDNSYSVGLASFGYKINESFLNGNTHLVQYSKPRFRTRLRKINKDDLESEIKLKSYPYLTRPFVRATIGIDAEKALNTLIQIRDKKELALLSENAPMFKITQVENSYTRQREKIMRIINNDYNETYGLDNTSFRFHSLITNLKKEVRPFITISGEEIVSLDIKNSQPFFMLLLFKPEAYLKYRKAKLVRLQDIEPTYSRYIYNTYTTIINPLMIQKPSKTLAQQQVQFCEFIKQVRAGMLYDYLLVKKNGEAILNNPSYETKRKWLKNKILILIYDINRSRRSTSGVYKLFIDHFKPVYDFLSQIKSYRTGETTRVRNGFKMVNGEKQTAWLEVDSGFKNLSILLQKIESKVILEICCKEIARRFPDIDFLTVHDSILVTKSMKDSVLQIIEEEIVKVTGEKPQISIE